MRGADFKWAWLPRSLPMGRFAVGVCQARAPEPTRSSERRFHWHGSRLWHVDRILTQSRASKQSQPERVLHPNGRPASCNVHAPVRSCVPVRWAYRGDRTMRAPRGAPMFRIEPVNRIVERNGPCPRRIVFGRTLSPVRLRSLGVRLSLVRTVHIGRRFSRQDNASPALEVKPRLQQCYELAEAFRCRRLFLRRDPECHAVV